MDQRVTTPLTAGAIERLKIAANFFNAMAVAFFSIGVLTPAVAAFAFRNIPTGNALGAAIVSAVFFVFTIALREAALDKASEIDR